MSKKPTHHLSKRKRHLYRVIAAIALLNAVIWSVVCFEELYKNRIMPTTTFAGVAIGGKTVAEAESLILAKQTTLLDKPITIEADDVHDTTTATGLGATIDTAELTNSLVERTKPAYLLRALRAHAAAPTPVFRFDSDTLGSFVTAFKQKVDRAPKNSGLSFTNNTLNETPPVNGRSLPVDTTENTLTTRIGDTIPSTITLSLDIVTPQLTQSSQLQTAKAKLATLLAKPLVLTANNQTVTLQPNQVFDSLTFGVVDNRLAYDIDQDKASTYLDSLAKKVYVAPVTRQLAANGAVLNEGKDGSQLNKVDAYKIIDTAVDSGTASTITLSMLTIPHKTTQDSGDFYDLNRSDGKYIDISLAKQQLATIENHQLVKIYAISTGKWSTPTPTGDFSVKNHISTARSALFPSLYMDDWMAITPDAAYGIHKLPYSIDGSGNKTWIEDPNHIGSPRSHGCIRLAPGESNEVYNWTPNGTPVFIHG